MNKVLSCRNVSYLRAHSGAMNTVIYGNIFRKPKHTTDTLEEDLFVKKCFELNSWGNKIPPEKFICKKAKELNSQVFKILLEF